MEKRLEVLQEQMISRSVPCDTELQELMYQIDIMVSNKKLEWEKKMQALEARMTVRDQELANAQSKLDQKGQEVGLLRQKLDSLQKTKHEMAQNYDEQLQALKTQFARLTQSYEKLQLHQLKQNKAHGKGKCAEEPPFQLSSLNQKLEEFKAKSREWDKQETLYQNHLVSLDAQRKLLSEKCNLFQKQAQNCQIQIGCQKLKWKEGGTCSQCKTEHLSLQHNVFAEPTDRKEHFMEKLRSTVSEIAVNRNRLQEENLKLQQEVKMYQRKCQNIEARLTEVKNELQSREDLLNMVELECQQLYKEVAKLEEYKNKEENEVKLRSAYAKCIMELETKKAQILVLEQQQENQQKELNQQTINLSGKEHKTCTDSTDTLEHENERLFSELVRLPKDTEIPLLVKSITYFGTNRANQASVKNQEKEERPVQNEGDWPAQSAIYENVVRYRTRIPVWQGQGGLVSSESRDNWPPQRPSRDREPVADGRSPSPLEVHTTRYSSCFPERNKSDTLLSHISVVEESQMPSPGTLFPATATEKFLQEEEKRARDFEKVLNAHIEELQRQSEKTLKKYGRLKQSRHR
ncbi:deuterosome assembly protein 1 isoform X2 [Hemicordylus capensis]|uniref:deuterosome assembly protein 1 isoform X2 n=1 Tax=Hemicordylus capensis TaxID=884348 RepID=UPI0023027F5A|nr:deuterosome assembly protein 1 isoform X2 [Hemicordylus capensis]